MRRLGVIEARRNFAEALNKAAYKGERIIVHRRGKDIAAIVSIEDLGLLEALEDRLDVEETDKILAEMRDKEWIPYEQIRKEAGFE
jgi:prevent-host-death family protein